MVLQNWVDDGNQVSDSELRRIVHGLYKIKRYKHALEILTWMETREGFKMTAFDHAVRLDSIIKKLSIAEGEKYYNNLPNITAKKYSFRHLLSFYVKERDTEKAEALMTRLNELGWIVNPHPLNEMMKLYAATSQFEKIAFVIQNMERNKIPKTFLSYNLWMTACAEVSGVSSVEVVFKKMEKDKNVMVGWSTLATLANIYIKFGLIDKATLALKAAESKLSARNQLGYFFLMTTYTSLKDKDMVLRLWEASKKVEGNLTCANYMTILSSLVKLNDIHEAEKIFTEWESKCRNYDIRVSNILLGAYMRKGDTEKAEALHLRTLDKGGHPNYKTYEILIEGWVRTRDMDKAINAMKKGFNMLKTCNWRPPPSIVTIFAEYFELTGDIDGAIKYVNILRHSGLASLQIYKSLLRLHTCKQMPISDIIAMMREDNIELDDEVSTLISSTEVREIQ